MNSIKFFWINPNVSIEEEHGILSIKLLHNGVIKNTVTLYLTYLDDEGSPYCDYRNGTTWLQDRLSKAII